MTISHQRLYQATCALHAAAEDEHRQQGAAAMAALFVPPTGPGQLYVFPDGMPPAEVLAAIARAVGAVGIAVTGEVWESTPGINGPTLIGMPFADLPRPSTDPDATEAILTTAAGIGHDGPIKLLRKTHIQRTLRGTVLHEATDLRTKIRDDGLAALLTLALAAGSRQHRDGTGDTTALDPGLRPDDGDTGQAG